MVITALEMTQQQQQQCRCQETVVKLCNLATENFAVPVKPEFPPPPSLIARAAMHQDQEIADSIANEMFSAMPGALTVTVILAGTGCQLFVWNQPQGGYMVHLKVCFITIQTIFDSGSLTYFPPSTHLEKTVADSGLGE